MGHQPRPLLQTIVRSAVEATAADAGWLAAVVDDASQLAIVAAHAVDPSRIDGLVWQRAPIGLGTASFAVQSGQPVALQPSGARGDEWAESLLGRPPTSVLCVPCDDGDQPVAALQLVDKAGGGPFSFDDVEMAILLGGIAGAAITEGSGSAGRVPSPAQLGADLGRLAEADPNRYVALAQAIAALVSQA